MSYWNYELIRLNPGTGKFNLIIALFSSYLWDFKE